MCHLDPRVWHGRSGMWRLPRLRFGFLEHLGSDARTTTRNLITGLAGVSSPWVLSDGRGRGWFCSSSIKSYRAGWDPVPYQQKMIAPTPASVELPLNYEGMFFLDQRWQNIPEPEK